MQRVLRFFAILGVFGMFAVACSDDGDKADIDETTTTTTAAEDPEPEPEPAPEPEPELEPVDTLGALIADAPEGLDFYTPPAELPGENGDIIWSREFGAVDGGMAHLILYRSESVVGDPIGVSGLIFVPDLEAPADGRTVFSWGNGTRGIADECANSREDDPTGSVPILTGLLERNIAVVVTDYEGLGTPGVHPYVIGASEGKGVLDAARAAQRFTPVAANNQVLLGGQSQGGHAQAFANQMANDYAPELDVLASIGTSAGVVVVTDSLVNLLTGLDQFRYIMMMSMAAQQAAYGDDLAPPSRLLTDLGVAELSHIEDGCTDVLGEYYAGFTQAELFKEDWDLTMTDGGNAGSLNQPGLAPNSAPMFLIHTRDDGLIPPGSVASYVETACAHGQPIGIEWWDGGHGLIYQSEVAQERAYEWVESVLNGDAPMDSCSDIPQPTDPA